MKEHIQSCSQGKLKGRYSRRVPVTDRERSPSRVSFVWLCAEDIEMWWGDMKRRQDNIYTNSISIIITTAESSSHVRAWRWSVMQPRSWRDTVVAVNSPLVWNASSSGINCKQERQRCQITIARLAQVIEVLKIEGDVISSRRDECGLSNVIRQGQCSLKTERTTNVNWFGLKGS